MRYKNFEIRKPTLLGEPPTKDYFKYNFDLVRWNDDHSSCLSLAFIRYDKNKGYFKLDLVGTRYWEYHENGLQEFLLRWCKLMEIIINGETE